MRGQIGVWIWVLVLLFVIGVVFLLLATPIKKIHDAVSPELSGEDAAVADRTLSSWRNFPVYFIIMVVVAGFFWMLQPVRQGG